ncbi:alpha/beta-hydrolase [Aspergillus sclerotiicarbonarius CBS 121057]|uniref:Alpha/beta-hydrolase n=1 Tax=Aspergillus sclerotiicarbonarius (strain CBS 121057 / IBT 28362) TaxID=1448318 RepID=A0A319EA93_ASPSB|nr:alpha/beta-hydrolase [Aspergillus sclerotiicarbonarius CBS 121057]
MDPIFARIAQETTNFQPGDEELWRNLYTPFYPSPPPTITVIRDQRYGPHARNTLDIFIPSNANTDNAPSHPVLVYVHGGGFFSGDKQWSEQVYSNIGCFFSQHDIITVIINHRLVPDVQYPGGADDIQMAREWIYANIASPRFGCGDVDKVLLLGHSSGGAHVAMNLYAAGDKERTSEVEVFPPVAGVMYLSVPFWYDSTKPVRRRTIGHYYGSDEEGVWGPKSALGLFQALPDDSPMLRETIDATLKFFNAYRARSTPPGTLPGFHVLKRHNHLSNILSIGTEDTAQGEHLLEFIWSCVKPGGGDGSR